MYPAIEPRETGFLDVGDGHNLYYELSGNPDGIPAVYLHGGPGGGSHPDMRRLFDPSRYNIILYDQRGCGKSTPFGSLNNNTIDSLTDDVDKLRRHLNIDKWVVTGGSWGSTLALLHTLKSQQAVSALVVSGTFYADKKGARWLAEEGGASEMVSPEWFAPYRDFIPPQDRHEGLVAAYDKIMKTGTDEQVLEATKRFVLWDTSILTYTPSPERLEEVEKDPKQFIPLNRIFFHFANTLYTDDNRHNILDGVKQLPSIPCHIVHGRWDLICPLRNAYELHEAFANSALHIVPETGHTSREPRLMQKLTEILDRLPEELLTSSPHELENRNSAARPAV